LGIFFRTWFGSIGVFLRRPAVRTARAFTLVELLVVIAIIAVLLGILLPSLAGAREASRATKCLNNVRSVAQGLHLYASEHREMFPHWSAWQVYRGDGSSNEDTPGPGWAELTEPYLDPAATGQLEAFKCPTRRQECIAVAYFLQSRFTAALTGGGFRRALRHTQVQFASPFVLTGDATNPYLFASPYGGPHQVPNVDPDDAREPATLYAAERDRVPHKAGSHLGFLDGHAGAFKVYEQGKMTWDGRGMKSWDEMVVVPGVGGE
jgi:prepilin-type N-terminal cleavage/methylation domain-containing protein